MLIEFLFGRLGTDTQFIYTTNKNITSFSQEENYDDIITRVTVTSKFKPDVDKEKIKQQQTNELNALKEQQQAYNKQIASEKRRQRMEREIESKIRKQELKKMNFEAQNIRSTNQWFVKNLRVLSKYDKKFKLNMITNKLK